MATFSPSLTFNSPLALTDATPGDDLLIGTAAADSICGLAGNDTISGREGNDTILAGLGDDLIRAGSGDDLIFGNAETMRFGQARAPIPFWTALAPIRFTCRVLEQS